MAEFGATPEGFTLKGFDLILSESLARAKSAFGQDEFGQDVDLTSTSPLRKLLEVTAFDDAELWKRMEDLYYGNFISTAIGDNLDLLGEDLGLQRQNLFAEGDVVFKVNNPARDRQYVVPEATVVVSGAPVRAFYTITSLTLNEAVRQQVARVRAFERGPASDLASGNIVGIDPAYQAVYFSNLGTATLTASNTTPFTGGLAEESDDVYRSRLLGLPRNLWTLESARRAALDVAGVTDVLLFDPLGGVDVGQSYFNLFNFSERLFSGERRLGEPYFFDIVVAHEFAWPWRTLGPVVGVYERVLAASNRVRPMGIYPNIVQANHIEVGLQARILIEPGSDPQGLIGSIKQRIASDIGRLKLGSDVLYSQVMCAIVEQTGVVDVQNLRLRRCPAAFGRITFGSVPFQSTVVEMGPGENLALNASEVAVFRIDSDLIDLEVVPR